MLYRCFQKKMSNAYKIKNFASVYKYFEMKFKETRQSVLATIYNLKCNIHI